MIKGFYWRLYCKCITNDLSFVLLGLGILKDEETVKSMSRTGNPRELLRGILLYGIVILYCTIVYWTDSPVGITTMLILCIGDGFAGLIGTWLQRSVAKSVFGPLPWNRSKTAIGVISFIVLSIIIG
jgi:phytol kinase